MVEIIIIVQTVQLNNWILEQTGSFILWLFAKTKVLVWLNACCSNVHTPICANKIYRNGKHVIFKHFSVADPRYG